MAGFYDLFNTPEPSAPQSAITATDGGTAYGRQALAQECATMRGAPEGQRNDQLNRSAFNLAQLVRGGHLEQAAVEQELGAAAQAAGLPELEIRRTLRSGMRGGDAKPRTAMPAPEDPVHEPMVTEVTIDQITGEVFEQQVDFWAARGILTHIRAFAYARMTSPWAVLGVLLLRALATIPPWVTLPPLIGGPGSLNLFLGLVGSSGTGKGAAEAAAPGGVRGLRLADGTDIYTAPVGSGEGIAHQYAHREKGALVRDRDQVLFSVPEVDTLSSLGNRQGSTLLAQLRSAFSGETLGFGYADPTKRLVIERHTYRLGMIVGIQPEKAGPLLADADGGTPQRFVWMPATDPHITADLHEEIQAWEVPRVHWRIAMSGHSHLPIPDEVALLVRENHAARARGEGTELDGHAMFAQLKVAVAFAVLDGRGAVCEGDWQLAQAVMAKSAATRAGVEARLRQVSEQAEQARIGRDSRRAVATSEALADASLQRVCRVIMRRLGVVDQSQASLSSLRRALASRDRDDFEAALERLVDAGLVVVDEIPNGAVARLIDGGDR